MESIEQGLIYIGISINTLSYVLFQQYKLFVFWWVSKKILFVIYRVIVTYCRKAVLGKLKEEKATKEKI